MVGVILKATNSSFQKGLTFCRSIYQKKVMKLLAFIFEQPSYFVQKPTFDYAQTKKAGVGYLVNFLNKTLYLTTVHKLKVPKPRVKQLSFFWSSTKRIMSTYFTLIGLFELHYVWVFRVLKVFLIFCL